MLKIWIPLKLNPNVCILDVKINLAILLKK